MAKQPHKFDSIVGSMLPNTPQPTASTKSTDAEQPIKSINLKLEPELKNKVDRLVLLRRLEGGKANQQTVIHDALRLYFSTDTDAARLLSTAK